jgi:UDP-glucose 4-epimerase
MVFPKTWLITGGAGYIGSHIADAFLDDGMDVILYDSLYRGLESRVQYLRDKHEKEIPLIIADIRDTEALALALRSYTPDGIIHTAALKSVEESTQKPEEYFEVNVHATRALLETISSIGIHNCIFSSTAAVYGTPDHSIPIRESDTKNPISPYGASKLAAENVIDDFLEHVENSGTSLRFFNVIGAASPELSDNSTDNLLPIVVNKIRRNEKVVIFGVDYPTSDGTCIRDYVDVRDVAIAHLAAAKSRALMPKAMNVGTGRGNSVRKMINLTASMLGQNDIDVVEGNRRAGDPASLTADTSLIKETLGFVSKFSLEESIGSSLAGLR